MVDVSAKPLTHRLAVARCAVVATSDAVAALGAAGHGVDPVEAARVAGIQAAKSTSSLVPLCHSIRVDHVSVDVVVSPHRIEIAAVAEVVERTGVEMEALTACAVAGLTLRRSLLELDPDASIEELTLWHKSGAGRQGLQGVREWQRTPEESGEWQRTPEESGEWQRTQRSPVNGRGLQSPGGSGGPPTSPRRESDDPLQRGKIS